MLITLVLRTKNILTLMSNDNVTPLRTIEDYVKEWQELRVQSAYVIFAAISQYGEDLVKAEMVRQGYAEEVK